MTGKEQVIDEFREDLRDKLPEKEIEERVCYEFFEETNKLSLKEQVRRYYLQIKSCNAETADQMLTEIGDIEETKEDTRRCFAILQKYTSGIIFYFNGNRYC